MRRLFSKMSASLLMGVCAYSNDIKQKVLGVSAETLKNHGAVSEQCALEMAQGARALGGADIGLSTTGVAGPDGGSEEKPVGTVFIGYADADTSEVIRVQIGGSRERVRMMACLNALNLLRKKIL